jgi:Septum formation
VGSRAGPRRRRPWSAALGVLVLAALVALVGWRLPGGMFGAGTDTDDADEAAQPVATSADPPPAPPPPTPAAPAPRRGECRTLAWDETQREVTDAAPRPSRCARAHTAQTFAVGRVAPAGPGRIVDADRLLAVASARCRSAVVGWLGDDERAYQLSMFAYVVAVPTSDDRAAGARWWRCDTFATERHGRLATLRGSTEGALTGATADRWATCVRRELGPVQQQVVCSEPHRWRAVSAHRLGGRGDPYPGPGEVTGRMRTTCRDDVSAYVADPLAGFGYGWLRPSGADWRAGQRFGLCFAETRD